jgi:hypothetical protein
VTNCEKDTGNPGESKMGKTGRDKKQNAQVGGLPERLFYILPVLIGTERRQK